MAVASATVEAVIGSVLSSLMFGDPAPVPPERRSSPESLPMQPLSREMVGKMAAALRCDELAGLLEWKEVARSAPANDWAYPELLHSAAVALVLTGFTGCRPALVREALGVLEALGPAGGPRAPLTMAVAMLLLGSVSEALELLEQATASSSG